MKFEIETFNVTVLGNDLQSQLVFVTFYVILTRKSVHSCTANLFVLSKAVYLISVNKLIIVNVLSGGKYIAKYLVQCIFKQYIQYNFSQNTAFLVNDMQFQSILTAFLAIILHFHAVVKIIFSQYTVS